MEALPDIGWFRNAPKRRRYLAGISGGADSVALLHLLHRHGFRDVIACHLHHGLRGRAADADARFVGRTAAGLGYRCESGQADIPALMEQGGESLETAARHARHSFFARCARLHRCRRLLLAHHADDQAETLLWNLLRGSRGLAGMAPLQTMAVSEEMRPPLPLEIHRPLLGTRAADLRSWLRAEKLPWREDATNSQPIAARNRLRHEALPLLSAIAQREATGSLLRAADSVAELRAIERWAVGAAAALDPQGRLHLPRLRELPPELAGACIHHFLTTAGVPDLSRAVLSRALSLLDATAPPAVALPGGRILRRRAGRMILTES